MAGSSKIKKPEKLKYFDYSLLFVIIFLVGFGLVMLYSVSSYEAQSEFGDAAYYLKKQLAAACLGLVAMFIVSRIDYHVWQKLSLPVYGLALLLCVAVLFLGSDSNGSSRWFRIGGLSVQPSEIAKIAVIIFTAALLCKTAKQIAKLQNLIKVFCFIAPIVLVIAVNNLSTAIIVAGIAFIMVFVVSPKYTHFIAFAAVAAVAVAGFILVQGYRADRISAWLHPEDHPDTAYQTYQNAGEMISFFLTPATVVLAVPIYRKLDVLKKNLVPIIAGALVGSLTSILSVLLFCRLFGLSDATTRSLVPKSVTTPIGVALSEMLGGLAPVTAIAVVFTGIVGAILLPTFLKCIGVRNPVQMGLSIGTAAHAVGTSRAIELGETEGAMSGLAIGVAGLLTALLVSVGSMFFG